MTENSKGIIFACITAFSWSILAIALKFSLQFSQPGSTVWLRMTVAFIVLMILLALKQPSQLSILKRPPTLTLLAGVFLAANYFGFLKGIQLTTVSNAQVLIQAGPLGLVLLSILIFKEKLSQIQLVGTTLAFTGFSIYYWEQLVLSASRLEEFKVGNVWMLMAIVTWIAYAVLQKFLNKKWQPQQINLIVYAVSTIVLLPLADFSNIGNFNLFEFIFIFALGLNTLIAYGCLGEALKRTSAGVVGLIIAVNPLLTIFLLWILPKLSIHWIPSESINLTALLGALCVVSGVALTVLKPRLKN